MSSGAHIRKYIKPPPAYSLPVSIRKRNRTHITKHPHHADFDARCTQICAIRFFWAINVRFSILKLPDGGDGGLFNGTKGDKIRPIFTLCKETKKAEIVFIHYAILSARVLWDGASPFLRFYVCYSQCHTTTANNILKRKISFWKMLCSKSNWMRDTRGVKWGNRMRYCKVEQFAWFGFKWPRCTRPSCACTLHNLNRCECYLLNVDRT